MAQFDDAALGRQDVGVRGQHLVDDRVIGDLLDLLRQEADAQVLAGADLAAVERHLPHDEAEQRGLAGAVGPDQPDAHARLDVQAGLVEERLAAEGFGDVGEVKHQTGRIAAAGGAADPPIPRDDPPAMSACGRPAPEARQSSQKSPLCGAGTTPSAGGRVQQLLDGLLALRRRSPG